MTECLRNYLITHSKCAIDWVRPSKTGNCSTFEEFGQVRDVWNWLYDASINEIINTTGCTQKCSYLHYELIRTTQKEMTGNSSKWLSELYVYTDSENVEERYI